MRLCYSQQAALRALARHAHAAGPWLRLEL